MATLAEAHRLGQITIGQQTTAQMLSIWPLLDPQDLIASYETWAPVATSIITTQYAASSELAAAYYSTTRQLAGIVDTFVPVIAPPLSQQRILTSLLVTGPGRVLAGYQRGESWWDITDRAAASSAGSAMRLALEGGRATLMQSGRADPRQPRWARITGDNPCDFCEMLASRGAVYFTEETADFEVHDHCNCEVDIEF